MLSYLVLLLPTATLNEVKVGGIVLFVRDPNQSINESITILCSQSSTQHHPSSSEDLNGVIVIISTITFIVIMIKK